MTNLTKPVSRVTPATAREVGKDRNIVVTMDGKLLGFRAKGCKRKYWLPISACYTMAVRASVLASKREKKKGSRSRPKGA